MLFKDVIGKPLSVAGSTTDSTLCHREFEFDRLLCYEIQVGLFLTRSGAKTLVDSDQSKSPCVAREVKVGFNW